MSNMENKIEKMVKKDLRKVVSGETRRTVPMKGNVKYNNVYNKNNGRDTSKDKERYLNLKDENYKNKKEIRRLEAAMSALARTKSSLIQSKACDEPFETSGKSEYLRSLLVPRDGAASVPDDVMRMHTLRTETITANIPVDGLDISTNGSGIIVLYPNHPTSLVGYHWQTSDNPSVEPKFDTALTVAQDLSDAYDYGRRTSCEVTVKSSTLPSGMYAINGTMNAVNVMGTLSELDLSADSNANYNTLLADTTNLFDKIGNVSVGDGVTVIGLPDTLVNPYIRLDDTSPSVTLAGNGETSYALISDDNQNLVYQVAQPWQAVSVPAGISNTLCEFSFNFDATMGCTWEIKNSLNYNPGTGIAAVTPILLVVTVTLMDPFGALITAPREECSFSLGENAPDVVTITGSLLGNYAGGTMVSPNILPPVGAVNVLVQMVNTSGNQYNIPTDPYNYTSVKFTSLMGSRPGVTYPVTVIAYQNVAAGSVLTISGVANYEVVPNPELRKNLPTKYPKYSPDELAYVKYILANRARFGIRSIYASPDYKNMIDHYKDLANMVQPKLQSAALSWKGIFDFGKRLVPGLANIAKSLVPESEPLVDFAQGLLGKSVAASGTPIILGARACTDLMDMSGHLSYDETMKLVSQKSLSLAANRRPKYRRPAIVLRRKPKPAPLRTVYFPTITVLDVKAQSYMTGEGLYGVFNHAEVIQYVRYLVPIDKTRTLGKGQIFGWKTEPGFVFPVTIDKDLILLPVNPNSGIIDVSGTWPQVSDHSCEGAIWTYVNIQFDQSFPYAITGQISLDHGVPVLKPNFVSDVKMQDLHSHGRLLAANDKKADLFVATLSDLRSLDIIVERQKADNYFLAACKKAVRS